MLRLLLRKQVYHDLICICVWQALGFTHWLRSKYLTCNWREEEMIISTFMSTRVLNDCCGISGTSWDQSDSPCTAGFIEEIGYEERSEPPSAWNALILKLQAGPYVFGQLYLLSVFVFVILHLHSWILIELKNMVDVSFITPFIYHSIYEMWVSRLTMYEYLCLPSLVTVNKVGCLSATVFSPVSAGKPDEWQTDSQRGSWKRSRSVQER